MELKTLEEVQQMERDGSLIGCFKVSDEIYHNEKCPGLTSTKVRRILKAPALYKWGQNPETKALVKGRAVHCKVLEPGEFTKRFCIKPDAADYPEALRTIPHLKAECKKLNIKVGTMKKEELEEALCEVDSAYKDLFWENYSNKIINGREVLSSSEMEMVEAINGKLSALELAQKLLEGHHEWAFWWRDPATGYLCKCKVDSLHIKAGLVTDLKKSKDASEDAFINSIYYYSYHIQAAFYIDGIRHAVAQTKHPLPIEFKVPDAFAFVVIEEVAPYLHAYYDLPPAFLQDGRKLYGEALETLKYCEFHNKWAAYAPIEDGRERITTIKPRPYMYSE